MTDANDTPSLVTRCTTALDTPSNSDVLALATIATDGPIQANEIAARTPIVNAYPVVNRLASTGLVDRCERELNNGGRNPFVYQLTPDGRSALAVDVPEWTTDAVAERVVHELATVHYVRELSSATVSRLAREIPGASAHMVSGALRKLDARGVVEQPNADTGTKGQWRLADPSEIVPFRAPATDGGIDR